MKKIFFISVIFFLMFFFVGTPTVFGAAKTHQILLITSEEGEPYQSVISLTKERLAKLGFREGQNINITRYSLDHYKGRARNILRRERNTHYDLVFVIGTIATIAMKELILDDPQYPKIVFSTVTDPVGIGVIENFSDPPRHNFTGVAYPVPVRKRFAFIKKVLPQARKIGLIYADMPQSHSYNRWVKDFLRNDPDFKNYEVLFREVPFAKSKGGMIRMGKESKKYIRELDPQVDMFLSANDQLALQPFFPKNVFEIGTKPLIGVGKYDVMEERGALAAIFPTPRGIAEQTADIIRRLLEGAVVSDVLPEETKDFEIAFDLKKADKYGIEIPPDLLKQAGVNIIEVP